MLTEEAHHMFVGETGVGRIVKRTADVMAANKVDDPDHVRALGVIDLMTIQRYLNFHYSVTLDLFGSDVSSNAATYFTCGLKGRYGETKIEDDHVLAETTYGVTEVSVGRLVDREAPALSTLNERLRDDYIAEVQAGVDRWNRHIEAAGLPFRLRLPHKGFHRAIGGFAGHYISPDGEVMTKDEWSARRRRWLPGEGDYAFVQSLMSGRVVEPGKFANWIAPPRTGINNQALDFEYVRFN
jgi:benzoyl-CoA 2,3-dioxygenase component B